MKLRLPLELVAPDLFLFILPFTHTTPLRLLCLALSIVSVIVSLIFSPRRRTRLVFPKWPVMLAIVFWFCVCLIACFNSVDRGYSWGEFRNEVCWTLVAFAVFYLLTDSVQVWRGWCAVLLAQSYAVSTLAIGSFFWYGRDWEREAWVGDRNAFSTYVVLMFPLLLFLLSGGIPSRSVDDPLDRSSPATRSTAPGLWRRLPALGALVLVLISGALTLNRILWLALALEVLVFAALFFRRASAVETPSAGVTRAPTRRWLAAAGLGLVFFAAMFAWVTIEKPVETETAETRQGFLHDPRLAIWTYAIGRAEERPWSGHGYGRGILRADFRERFHSALKWHGHNVVLNYAIEAGVPGAIAIAGLFAAFFAQCWQLYRSGDCTVWPLGAVGLAVLAGITVKMMTDDILVRDNALLLWSMLGMIWGLGLRRQALSRSPADLPEPSA